MFFILYHCPYCCHCFCIASVYSQEGLSNTDLQWYNMWQYNLIQFDSPQHIHQWPKTFSLLTAELNNIDLIMTTVQIVVIIHSLDLTGYVVFMMNNFDQLVWYGPICISQVQPGHLSLLWASLMSCVTTPVCSKPPGMPSFCIEVSMYLFFRRIMVSCCDMTLKNILHTKERDGSWPRFPITMNLRGYKPFLRVILRMFVNFYMRLPNKHECASPALEKM